MLRKAFLSCVALSVCMSLALIGGASPQPPANLTAADIVDRNSTRLNSSHLVISYAVFCLKKKKNKKQDANNCQRYILRARNERSSYNSKSCMSRDVRDAAQTYMSQSSAVRCAIRYDAVHR